MRACPRPDSITFSVLQGAIIPNRDITGPAPRESERAGSELGCDEQHAERIMQESLGGPEKDETKDELGSRILAAFMNYQLHPKSVDYTMKTYLSGKEVDSSWGELGWALLEMMNAGLAERTLGPALRSLTAKIQ
jgi:hypothetical protein